MSWTQLHPELPPPTSGHGSDARPSPRIVPERSSSSGAISGTEGTDVRLASRWFATGFRTVPRGPARRAALGAVAVALLLAVMTQSPGLLGTHPAVEASGGARPPLLPRAVHIAPGPASAPEVGSAPWQTFDSGNVTLYFGTQAPVVTLVEDANPSVQATLTFEHIFEVSTGARGQGGNHGPMGLLGRAFAFPSGTTSWSSSLHGNLSNPRGIWLNLSANLTVRALVEGALPGNPVWGGTEGELPASSWGVTLGLTSVEVSFHLSGVDTPGRQGVAKVGVSLSGWPWVDPTDGLALEWQFFGPGNGTATETCSSAAPPANGTLGTSPCASPSALGAGQPLWANSTTAVESVALGSLVSYVAWTNTGTVTLLGGATQSVTLGAALFPVGGSTLVRLLQTVPSGLGTVTRFSEDPTVGLLPTLPPGLEKSLPPVLQGDLGAFVLAAAVSAVVLLGVWGLRKRGDRRALAKF